MNHNEANSFTTLTANIRAPHDRFDRVENLVLDGMPDSCLTLEGVDVWVEVKTPKKLPVRLTTALLSLSHKLSQEQQNWLLRHRNAGGQGFVYIDAPNRRYLIGACEADRVNGATPAQMQMMAVWSAPVPTSKDEWANLRKALRGTDTS